MELASDAVKWQAKLSKISCSRNATIQERRQDSILHSDKVQDTAIILWMTKKKSSTICILKFPSQNRSGQEYRELRLSLAIISKL